MLARPRPAVAMKQCTLTPDTGLPAESVTRAVSRVSGSPTKVMLAAVWVGPAGLMSWASRASLEVSVSVAGSPTQMMRTESEPSPDRAVMVASVAVRDRTSKMTMPSGLLAKTPSMQVSAGSSHEPVPPPPLWSLTA